MDQVVDYVLSLLKSHKDAMVMKTQKNKKQYCWAHPLVGALKLNVDRAMFYDQQRAGTGAILQEHKGEVIKGASKIKSIVNDSSHIELLAIFRGLQLCVHQYIKDIILESDSLLMVNEIKAGGESMAPQENLITKIRELMKMFNSCTIQHIGREGNEVAHKLAKFSWQVDDLCVWWESFPSCISEVIWSEK